VNSYLLLASLSTSFAPDLAKGKLRSGSREQRTTLLTSMQAALKHMPSELAAACHAVLNNSSIFHPFKVVAAALGKAPSRPCFWRALTRFLTLNLHFLSHTRAFPRALAAQLLESSHPISMHSRSHLKLLADGVAARFYAADCTRDMFDDNDLAHILITLANFDESFDMSMIVKVCVLACVGACIRACPRIQHPLL